MSQARDDAACSGLTSASMSSRGIQDAVDFLDGVAVALHQVGRDGTVIWANQAELDMLGYSMDEYVGRHIADFHADPDVLADILIRLSNGETLRNQPARLWARDGSIRDVLITSSAVLKDGELVNTRCVTIDVTEQRRARETSALLAAIVDSSDDAIISKSPEGIISSWNRGAERLFGYTAAEAIGRHITLIIPPELHTEEDRILARVRNGEKIDHYETVRVAKDGRRIEISLTISPMRGSDGCITGASKIARDITGRRRAEAALRESETRLRMVIDALPAAIYTTDAEGRVTHFNPAAVELAGRMPIAGADRWCVSWKLKRPDGTPLPLDQCPMAVALKKGRAIRGEEIVVQRPDGGEARAAAYPTPLRDSAGNVTGAINMLLDITERKRGEQALRDSEERYGRLTELLPVAVYTCEAPGGTISYFNERAVELWGRAPSLRDPAERYCGSARLFLPDGTPLPHDECPMAVALKEGRRFRNCDVIVERPDGSRINALVNIEPVRNAQGHIVAAINVCLDVTGLKQAEARLLEADRRKDEFLAILAHELRNPLAPLRHLLEIIKRSSNDHRIVANTRDAMDRQVRQMVRLIDDLLDVSRITHDKLELRRESVMLADVIQRAVETSRPVIEEAGHRLAIHVPEQPVRLEADPVRLAQVVGNLLSNACKYMAPGGEIALSADLAEGEVVLSVQDQGEGIPPQKIDAIFEMFVQADRSMEHSRGGLGIGLTLVKRLVELHGGSVRAFSDGRGCGSTFVVRLPAAGNQQAAKAPAAVPVRERTSREWRILIVDDNRDSADSLAALLTLEDYETERAYHGAEALETAERFRPDVVLLDLGLPGMSGYDVCRAIRRRTWGKAVFVVAFTGWGQEQDRQRSREAGFDAHLVKPVELAAIEELLSSRSAIR